MYTNNPELQIQIVRQRQDELRRVAGHARLRRQAQRVQHHRQRRP
jgi:hypothetical protein